jgi:hypothetical protein
MLPKQWVRAKQKLKGVRSLVLQGAVVDSVDDAVGEFTPGPNTLGPMDGPPLVEMVPERGTDRVVRRRVAWMIVDQALSSVSNIATAIVAAATLSARDFGAFGAAFLVYALVIGVCRGIVTEPLISMHSHIETESLRPWLSAAAGSAIDLGVVSALGIVVIAAVLGGVSWIALGALALVLPGLLLQDAWRYCYVAAGRPKAAVVNDSVWCGIEAVALALLLLTGNLTLGTIVLAWGGSGAIAGLVGSVQAGTTPRIMSTRRWLAEHRHLSWRYTSEFALATGSSQVALILVGPLAGLAALGALRGALVFFGPVVVIFTGSYLALAAEGARMRDQPARLRRMMVSTSFALVVVGSLSLLTGIFLPGSIGRSLFGETWEPARRVLVPVGVAVLGNCAASGAVVGLRALAAARASLRARLIVAPLSLVAPLVGATRGAAGFAVGLAITAWFSVFVWWRQFGRALAETAPSAPAQA